MTSKNTEKKHARAIQEDTGWSYQHCLNLVRTKTAEELDVLVAEHKKKASAPQ